MIQTNDSIKNMKTIRTLVVDDEPFIRKSIVKSIETANSMFSIIAEAGDGISALQIIKEQTPDVVFVDINMPLMDGIELIQKISLLDIAPVCVILSGYSDFKYAKSAIQYHVTNYLLKPIDFSELETVLASIQSDLMNISKINQYLYFDHIIRGTKLTINSADIKHCFSQYSIFYPFTINFGSYMIEKNNQFSLPNSLSYNEYIEKAWYKIGNSSASQWILSGESSNERIVILGFDQPISNSLIQGMMSAYYDELVLLDIPVTLIKGNSTTDIESLVPNIIDIKYMSPSIIRYGYSTLASYQDKPEVDAEKINFSAETVKLLRDLRVSENKLEYMQVTQNILLQCKKKQIPQILLQSVSKYILQIASNEIYTLNYDSFINNLITNTFSYDIYIDEYIKYLSQFLGCAQSTTYGDAINEIRAYINDHFTEELSLSLLSTKFHISISHFSVQFKKRFDMSPNEYIIAKRIERAKQLLHITPPISIKQISSMIGYTDQYYFSRIFKSVTGMSPTDYQSQN